MNISDCFNCFKFPRVFDIKGMYYVSCSTCDLANANFDKNECYMAWNNRSATERLYAEIIHSGALKISEFKLMMK